MNRKEALEHFEDKYTLPYYIQMDKDINKYVDEHRMELTEAFVENFRELCIKIKAMQDEGRKSKIGYIVYFFDIHNLQKESRDYTVKAYGEEWFLEDEEECKIKYNAGWLFDFLDSTYKELVEISKKYMGKINGPDLDEVWKDGVIYCTDSLLNFAKKAIKEAVKINEFKAIDIEEVLEIRLGQEKGYNEIIHKVDTRIKDSKKIKAWLEAGEEEHYYHILQNLDLSGGNYRGVTCHSFDFSGSNLSNSNFEDADLLKSVFVKSIINGVNFKKASLSEGDFSDTVLENCDFQESDINRAVLTRAKFINCNLSKTLINRSDLSDCTFNNCILTNTDFSFSNLENVDLSKSNLKDAVFIAVKLTGADLSYADLTGAVFANIDFTTFKFDNAKFSNNRIKGIKVYSKDLHRFNLSEEQLKEVTIVD